MAVSVKTVRLLDPRAEDVPEELGLSGKLPSLTGKTIGLLENRKYHADAFLKELQRVLVDDYGAGKVIYAPKFTYSAACSKETLESLTSQCDAVIHGIAD